MFCKWNMTSRLSRESTHSRKGIHFISFDIRWDANTQRISICTSLNLALQITITWKTFLRPDILTSACTFKDWSVYLSSFFFLNHHSFWCFWFLVCCLDLKSTTCGHFLRKLPTRLIRFSPWRRKLRRCFWFFVSESECKIRVYYGSAFFWYFRQILWKNVSILITLFPH